MIEIDGITITEAQVVEIRVLALAFVRGQAHIPSETDQVIVYVNGGNMDESARVSFLPGMVDAAWVDEDGTPIICI